MALKKAIAAIITVLAVTMGILADANAASVTVKCETRGTTRSKISVDGTGLVGTYYALVYSPGSIPSTVQSKASKTAVSGEVEFDFDSNPADIAAGATKISPTFIKNHTVIGQIRRTSDKVLFGSMKVTNCAAK